VKLRVFSIVTLAANLGLIGWISRASFVHFDRTGPEPPGMTFIRVATPSGALANLGIWLASKSPPAFFEIVCAFILVVVSAAVFWLALRETGDRTLSLAFSERTPPAVVDRGIYSRIRHPFYAAYLCYWASWIPFTSGNGFTIGIFCLMAITYIRAALREERALLTGLGESYRAYMARTKRFIPFVI
jgi:protein-S-isoprenylcysteine O-methyltransferase Ste14